MLIITLEGGLVQDILTDNPVLLKEKAIIVDYDAEGSDDYVTTEKGEECCPCRHKIAKAGKRYVADIVRITNERERMKQEG